MPGDDFDERVGFSAPTNPFPPSASLFVPAVRELSPVFRWMTLRFPARVAEFVGRQVMGRCQTIATILSVLWGTGRLAIQPSSWTQPVRTVFSRQLLFTGVDAVPVVLRFGGAVGILIIVQAALWVDMLGITTDVIAPLLWRAIVRELAPLMACLVVIGRSGVAISTELATMVVGGELDVLDAQGVDPMTYLIMPRIISVTISVFGLAMLMAVTMIVTGYAIAWAMDAVRVSWGTFLDGILREFNTLDVLFFGTKTIIAGAFAGGICCLDGMNVRGTITDVPRVSSRSAIRALTAVFTVSAILSILIYGRLLVFQIG